ncbi:hypothetical protein LMIY3S_04850 [Labrys miyagiensis]
MAEERRVLVNPLLTLRTSPATEKVTGRSKDASKIDPNVFRTRQANLISSLDRLRDADATLQAMHAGCVLIWVGMDAKSQAKSHTPTDLFSKEVETRLLASWRDGYIVEFTSQAFEKVSDRARAPTSPGQRCDIFRIEAVQLLASQLLRHANIEGDWTRAFKADDGAAVFNVRMPRFQSIAARQSVIDTLLRFAINLRTIAPSTMDLGPMRLGTEELTGFQPTDIAAEIVRGHIVASAYNDQIFSLRMRDERSLVALVASGTITRWEPVAQIKANLPGVGAEPSLKLPPLDTAPIVGVIDGGYHRERYHGAIAWRLTPPLIPDHEADREHGNKIVTTTVEAHNWSNSLDLPALYCRVGVVQAVPAQGQLSSRLVTEQQLLHHIEQAFARHPDTHVWNLSANFDRECHEIEVSEFGHKLAYLARRYDKLLVISAGNRTAGGTSTLPTERIAPPADCEAALVVGGRIHDLLGKPAGPCDRSRAGYGPEGMLKPEASWFSKHRVLGGGTDQGTSFAAPLVSRLAAHTWQNIDKANPDLVKALVLTACDMEAYDPALGFGSPVQPSLPWLSPSNAVTIAWTAELSSAQRYYWTGIRVPASLIVDGRFVGQAKLVAIVEPTVHYEGHSYFSNRLETSLQYRTITAKGTENISILGCLNPKEKELSARIFDHKWDPIRVYRRRFTNKNGPKLDLFEPQLQVYARMFWRNEFMYTTSLMRDHLARASFVLTLQAEDSDADTYNEFRQLMGSDVDIATVEQQVEIDSAVDE